jgi:cytochrome P450 / NADPH-cytochrome P450 reductase
MACILIKTWEKHGPDRVFDPYEEFYKFNLDLTAHCAFGVETNSMEDGTPHYFGLDLTYFFSESGKRAARPAFVTRYLLRERDRKYWKAIEKVQAFAREAIKKRHESGQRKNDILDAMLHNTDPVTGKRMTEESCMFNTLSLLGAGRSSTF